MSDDIDVIVVGAGPAGGSAAWHLAHRGHRVVLLDRAAFPRDKACGDVITRAGATLLEEMGVLPHLRQARGIAGLSLLVGPAGARTARQMRYADGDRHDGRYALIVPRTVLDETIARQAERAGALFRDRAQVRRLVTRDGVVQGVEAVIDGQSTTLRAPMVIAADGAASTVARLAGLVRPPRRRGQAVRAYFQQDAEPTDMLQIFMPLTHPADGVRLPAYGWVFPMHGGRLNVGVGMGEPWPGLRLSELFERFVAELRRSLPGFRAARQVTRLRGAPVNFTFEPRRAWAPGLVLAGEAAGMINPMTGEGISFALESGRLAAQVVHAHLKSGEVADLSDYAARLTRTFSGHLETGRHTAARYRLGWRILQDTFDSDRPLFALTRRVVFAPDHNDAARTVEAVGSIRACLRPGLRLGAQLAEVAEILADTARADWPFLLRLHALISPQYSVAPRPSLLALLAARFGRPDRAPVTAVAAAADLTGVAAIAQTSVDVTPPAGPRRGRPNWGTMFAVLTADLLLARALELCATSDRDLTGQLTQIIEDGCRGRMTELAAGREPLQTSRVPKSARHTGLAALSGAACELGARAALAPERAVRALAAYGRDLGCAAQLIDDVRRLSGGLDHLGRDALADLEDTTPSLPFRLAAARWPAGTGADLLDGSSPRTERAAELARLVAGTGALEQARKWIRRLLHTAVAELAPLPDGPARRSLEAIAQRTLEETERIHRPIETRNERPPSGKHLPPTEDRTPEAFSDMPRRGHDKAATVTR